MNVSKKMRFALEKRALLVSIKMKSISNSKRSRDAERTVSREHDVDAESGRYSKTLFPRDALMPIKRIDNAIRAYSLEHTLPWTNAGQRILPASLQAEFDRNVTALLRDRDRAVKEFAADVPAHKSAASAALGKLFQDSDYPADATSCFSASLEYLPVQNESDFRLEISDEIMTNIRTSAEITIKKATADAVADTYRRIADVTKKLHVGLASTKKNKSGRPTFRDSLIDNVRDLIEILPDLNLTDDPGLSDLRQELIDLTADADPADLRKNTKKRKNTAKKAADIAARIGVQVDDKPEGASNNDGK